MEQLVRKLLGHNGSALLFLVLLTNTLIQITDTFRLFPKYERFHEEIHKNFIVVVQFFSAIDSLREMSFVEFETIQTAILTVFEAVNFYFGEFSQVVPVLKFTKI